MSNLFNSEEYNMVDNAAGLCAGLAGYHFMKNKLTVTYIRGNGFTRVGCQLIEALVGIEVGKKVREETHKIRTGLVKIKEES